MTTSIALVATLFTLSGCHFRSSYDSYGSSYGRGYDRTESVYMEVEFYPEERGYTGVFNGRDNYYPRDDYWYGGYRAAAVSTSEDKIVSKNDETKASEDKN